MEQYKILLTFGWKKRKDQVYSAECQTLSTRIRESTKISVVQWNEQVHWSDSLILFATIYMIT